MFEASDLLALAPVAERAGFHLVAVPESVFFPEEVSAPYPYSPDGTRFWAAETPFTDPLLAIAAMSARTTTMRFVTNVLKAPLRHPLLLAKQVASLAVLTDERLELGVGSSWIPEEFAWLGTEKRTRGARLDEAIDILRVVCGGGGPRWVEYHGRHHDFGRLMVSPSPSRPVPVHVGGHSDAALRRAARVGDGWISVQTTSAEAAEVVARLAELREAEGRSDDPFDVNVLCLDIVPGADGVEGFAAFADQVRAAGMRPVFQVVPWFFAGGDPSDQQVRAESLERFGAEVIDVLADA
jgi:probable F420-dependent oxidoreductase